MKVNLKRQEWLRIMCSLRFESEGIENTNSYKYLQRLADEIEEQIS